MEMAVDLALMLVVGVLCTKHRRTHRAGEMFNVVFTVQGRNIRATQGTAALVTQQIQTSEIVDLAKGVLPTAVFPVDGKELGRDNLTTVLHPQPSQRQNRSHDLLLLFFATYLTPKTLQVKSCTQSSHELTDEGFTALLTHAWGTPRRLGVRSRTWTRSVTRSRSVPICRGRIARSRWISCNGGKIRV